MTSIVTGKKYYTKSCKRHDISTRSTYLRVRCTDHRERVPARPTRAPFASHIVTSSSSRWKSRDKTSKIAETESTKPISLITIAVPTKVTMSSITTTIPNITRWSTPINNINDTFISYYITNEDVNTTYSTNITDNNTDNTTGDNDTNSMALSINTTSYDTNDSTSITSSTISDTTTETTSHTHSDSTDTTTSRTSTAITGIADSAITIPRSDTITSNTPGDYYMRYVNSSSDNGTTTTASTYRDVTTIDDVTDDLALRDVMSLDDRTSVTTVVYYVTAVYRTEHG